MDSLLAVLFGLAGGIVGGLLGVGGGILFVPALAIFLDESQLGAEATSLLAILPTVVAGAWRQRRYGNVRWRPGIVLGVAGIAGVQAGVWIARSLSDETLRRLFGLLMIVVAAQIAWNAFRSSGQPLEPEPEKT